MINVFEPSLGEAELAAVGEVFATGWLGHGPRTRRFEEAFAAHLGVPAGSTIMINSCTAGLFLAVELLDLGPGDEVVLPSISFVAAANAIAASGATAVFCDVDPRTLNPTVQHIAACVTERTRAVLALHYGGYPGDIAGIAAYCRERGVPLIEDAACAVASRADGQACGTFGDLAVWSFDAMKVLVTGDGGMLYVRDPALAETARQLAYHGLAQPNGLANARVTQRWWELDVRHFARRVIGNDVTAAIGLVQLDRLPSFVARRREVTKWYDRELADLPGVLLPPPLPEPHESSHYFYWLQLPADQRDEIAADLLADDVYTTFRYPPLHRVPAYGSRATLPHTDHAADTTLCLPLHQSLDEADLRHVVTALRKAVEARALA